jgi:DNA-binding transcriptional MerR regulator/effector-binding domain-containing protein
VSTGINGPVMLTISEFARLGQVSPRMLRHYDETGLLTPARVDAQTGYRFYDVGQLARLHRLVALRELGFGLDQIRPILDEELPAGELRGMLRMRKAQIEQNLAGEQTRLRRIEAHLRALERGQVMELRDVVIKLSEPVRVAEAVVSAPGFGPENIAPVFRPLFAQVWGSLRERGVRPGINIARYEGPEEDGSVLLHVGFDIGGQDATSDGPLRVTDLPPVRVAALVHHGTMEDIAPAFEALIAWTKDSGYALTGLSRELYHHWDDDDPAGHITELQLLLAAP